MNSTRLKILVLVLLAASLGIMGYQVMSLQNREKDEKLESNRQGENGTKSQEEVEEEIICTLNFDPVCGTINNEEKSFGNRCEAEKAGATKIEEGLCSPLESCPSEKDPVCGTIDGNRTNFDNLCIAEAAGATEIEENNCPPPPKPETPDDLAQACPEEVIPVCGTIQGVKTDFDNECKAQNAGATEITEGKCVLAAE